MPSSLPHPLLRSLQWAEQLPRWLGVSVTLALALLLGVGDFLTGAFVAFTALYLVPISLAAWFSSRWLGIGIALLCTVEWLVTDFLTRPQPLTPTQFAWNLGAQLLVFMLVATLVHTLRLALVEERNALLAEHRRALETQHQLEHAQRLATVGKLAAGVAHELGTPLNVVDSYAQLLGEGAVELPSSTRIIREQVAGMTRIVRQLVDFARAHKPSRARHALRPLLETTATLLRPMAKKKQVELACAGDATLEADVDAGQLQQVLSNLVVNALHAVERDGRVTLSVSREHAVPPPDVGGEARDCVVLRVEDDGPGIAAEVLEHLFEPFVTTKDIGEGSGLGLAVAWGLVREHGGWMTAHNREGRGACFSVFLPAA